MGREGALILAVLLLATASPDARAQTSRSDPTDVQSWYSAEVHFDLPSKWQTSLQYRLRLVDNSSAYRGSYVTAEVGRGLGEHLTLLASYRLALVDDGTYHRFAGGAEAAVELEPFTLSLRPLLAYQQQHFEGDDEQSSDEDTYVRTRLEGKFRATDSFDVYASTEPYFKFGGDYWVDNWRNEVGVRYEFLKDAKVGFFYIYRPDYAKRTYNRTFHVFGIDLDFDVKVRGRGK